MFSKKILFLSIFFWLGTALLPFCAEAATPQVTIKDTTYSATLVSQSIADPVVIPAGTSKAITFTFKNTGTATWAASGKYISAYTMEPRDRKSIFFASDWTNAKQTGKIATAVKPGQTGKLTVTFKVPAGTKPGEYTEKFYLAAENYTWVKNGYFFVKIKVTAAPSNSTATETPTTPTTPTESTLNRVFLNPKTVKAVGGEPVTVLFAYQNIGKSVWTSASIEQTGPVNFADSNWSSRQMAFEKTISVAKDTFWRDQFTFRAPAKAGTYEAKFKVKVKGETNSAIDMVIPVTVTADAPIDYVEPYAGAVSPDYAFLTETPRLAVEPRIRVGLWKDPAGNTAKVLSNEDDYNVIGATGNLGILPRGTEATLSFKNGLYTLESEALIATSTLFIRVEPATNPKAISAITNYVRKITGKSTKNFNQYRGALELRQAQDQNNSVYLINELNFEDYMSGMGENSNASPIEYLKAQAIAQRTYAYYVQTTSKHESRFFDVVAHTGDQLYLGAANEPSMPRFIDAVNSTRGLMVTYNNNVVITPYFGNSDGKTRSWTQVWGGSAKPWLVPVEAVYDERDNKSMFGHGVGMSQRDAAIKADEEKLDFVQLVKYYYTGVELHKIY